MMRNDQETLEFVREMVNGNDRTWRIFVKEFHAIFEGYLNHRIGFLDRDAVLSNFYWKLVDEDYERLKKFHYGGQRGFVNYLISILANEIKTESNNKHYTKNSDIYDPITEKLRDLEALKTNPEPLPEENEIIEGITEEIFLKAVMQLKNLGEREAIYLYFRGHTNQEIADIMKKPINTILSWNKRSKEKLKKILEKYRGVQ